MKQINLAIADNHPLFMKGFAAAVNTVDHLNLIIEARNGKELIEQIKLRKPNLVLMDLRMPEMDGIEATAYIKEHFPDIRIIILTGYSNGYTIACLMRRGINGYLLKNENFSEIKRAIDIVMKDEFYYSNYVSRAMQMGLGGLKNIRPGYDYKVSLTKLEIKVLNLICDGNTTGEIAQSMCLSPRTIESYRYNLLGKIGVKNTASLVKYAIENNLVDLDLRVVQH